jgi:hypothetical protein
LQRGAVEAFHCERPSTFEVMRNHHARILFYSLGQSTLKRWLKRLSDGVNGYLFQIPFTYPKMTHLGRSPVLNAPRYFEGDKP